MPQTIAKVVDRVRREESLAAAQARCSLYYDARLSRRGTATEHHARIGPLADRLAGALEAADARHGGVPARAAAAAMLAVPTLRKLGFAGRTFVARVNASPSSGAVAALTTHYLEAKVLPRMAVAAQRLRLEDKLATPMCHLTRHRAFVQEAAEDFFVPRSLSMAFDRQISTLLSERAGG